MYLCRKALGQMYLCTSCREWSLIVSTPKRGFSASQVLLTASQKKGLCRKEAEEMAADRILLSCCSSKIWSVVMFRSWMGATFVEGRALDKRKS